MPSPPDLSSCKNVLVNLIKDTVADWKPVHDRILSHPEDCAEITGVGGGFTALHLAVCRVTSPPVETLEAFFDANPDSVVTKCRSATWTPLMASAHFNNITAVKFLLEVGPEAAAIQDKEGRVPVHVAGSREIVELLVEAYPQGLSVQSLTGCIPLHEHLGVGFGARLDIIQYLLAEGWKHDVGGPHGGGGVFMKDMEKFSALDRIAASFVLAPNAFCWETLQVLFRSAHSAATGSKIIYFSHILCCVIGAGAGPAGGGGGKGAVVSGGVEYPELVSTIVDRFPEEIMRTDYRGKTPLEIATSQGCSYGIIKKLLGTPCGRALAGRPDDDGRLPLHLASESGMGLPGIKCLMDAEKRAVATPDKCSHMYPFMLAATAGDKSDLDSVYYLLRAVPDKLQHLMTTPETRNNNKEEIAELK